MTIDSLVAPATHDAPPAPPAGRTATPTSRQHLVAHWVTMPGDDGRERLTCVWETPID
jgi:hypothetical protein